ncbi:hypothetical protein ACTHAL_004256 [Priestia flexa]|uniref:hypothetical protein n=1 Tax=Priestia flexa TaxID=86664 RepID=UPI0004743F6F|nr:hypothetical protein [Priestia flexa]
MNWEEAKAIVNEGKTVFFHHRAKVVPVNKDTTFQDLQWNYFGSLELTWADIVNGKYSIA